MKSLHEPFGLQSASHAPIGGGHLLKDMAPKNKTAMKVPVKKGLKKAVKKIAVQKRQKKAEKKPVMKKWKFRVTKKKPSADVEVIDSDADENKKEDKSYEQMNEQIIALLDRPWKDLSKKEKETIMAQLPAPSGGMYRDFHKAMRNQRSRMPEIVKEDVIISIDVVIVIIIVTITSTITIIIVIIIV